MTTGFLHRQLLVVEFLVIAALVAPPAYSAPATQPSANDPAAAAKLTLAKSVPSVTFKNTALTEALDFLHDVCRADFVVDWNALKLVGVTPKTRVSVVVRDTPLSVVLSSMFQHLAPKAIECSPQRQGIILISTTKALANPGASDQIKTLIALHRSTLITDFKNMPLTDCIDFVQETAFVNISVNWTALKAAGVDKNTPVTLSTPQLDAPFVLRLIFRKAGAEKKMTYIVDQGVVKISTPEDLKINIADQPL